MSGHSKWATTKHRKGAKDNARGKLFAKLIRQVEVAAREGGGDVNSNATLRTMFQQGSRCLRPLETIERAIKRGTGELDGVRYEAVAYEGYAPSGVALIVETLTDNRNRTGADIRSLFSRNGGSMAEPGAVSWQFGRKGVVMVPKTVGEDELMAVALDAGAGGSRRRGGRVDADVRPDRPAEAPDGARRAAIPTDAADVEMVPLRESRSNESRRRAGPQAHRTPRGP